MTIIVVQQTPAVTTSSGANGGYLNGDLSSTMTMPNPTTSGNALLVLCNIFNFGATGSAAAPTASVNTDNKGNNYGSNIYSNTQTEDLNCFGQFYFLCTNIIGGSSHQIPLTFTAPNSGTLMGTIQIYEISGLSGSSTLDSGASNVNKTSNGGTNPFAVSTPSTLLQASEILFSMCSDNSFVNDLGAPSSPWNTGSLLNDSNGATLNTCMIYQIVSSTAQVTASFTEPTTGHGMLATIIALKGSLSSGLTSISCIGKLNAIDLMTSGSSSIGAYVA